jgi:hypothetical protein
MGKEFISSIKPNSIPGKQKPTPKIEWNNRTYESYIKHGLTFEEFNLPRFNKQERDFLQLVDERQGPIERELTRMVRLKAIDYTTKNKERKEYLYYFENWRGKDGRGVSIAPVTDHVEGMYYEQENELVLDPNTGDATKYKRKGQHEAYYIPFSKKEVDRIIAEHNTNPELVNFTVKFDAADSPDGQRRFATRGQFGYDQFVNWTFDDLYKLHIRPWKELDPNEGLATRMYK